MKLIRAIYKFFDKRVIVPITKLFVNLGNNLKKINKPLETLAKTKSSIIVLSLVISIFIFFFVDRRSTTLLETNAKVLYNQPVVAAYNDEELYEKYSNPSSNISSNAIEPILKVLSGEKRNTVCITGVQWSLYSESLIA